ncbi:MAG: nucleotidyl transferase AbiEii/AbiGii toxin family protein [Myxococcales bacterium]|nr:nucleotidyl transferase AbiEii/AbiGii toxin family protein [Myxococcales bacterium]
MLTREQLQRAAAKTGFTTDSLEKVWRLVQLLNGIVAHPFLEPRIALKGGTALKLFVFDVPRLSVDIDLNYIGAADRETMIAERPAVDVALKQVLGRLGLTVKRAPNEHAGGKWRLSYISALGRSAILEVDVNYMLRVPLWSPTKRDSFEFIGDRAKQVAVLDHHELAAGKLAALLARGASRDLFDSRELLKSRSFEPAKLRIAFVVYGGINRVDWRTVATSTVTTTVEDVKRQLLPMLRHDIRPEAHDVEEWTNELIEETRDLLGTVLPLTDNEIEFLNGLNGEGAIKPELLTDEMGLQQRIRSNPGLQWKALNVEKHADRPHD